VVDVTVKDSGRLALFTARLERASGLGAEALRRGVSDLYAALFRAADLRNARHPVRMWSFIPDIHAVRKDGLTTYHVFNQGRFAAFSRVFGNGGAGRGGRSRGGGRRRRGSVTVRRTWWCIA